MGSESRAGVKRGEMKMGQEFTLARDSDPKFVTKFATKFVEVK